MNLVSTNSVKSAVGTFNTISNSIFSSSSSTIQTGTFAELLPINPARTTNIFTNGVGNTMTVIVDAIGRIVSWTIN